MTAISRQILQRRSSPVGWLMALALLPAGLAGTWFGSQDLRSPLTITAQVVGFSFFGAGLLCLIGVTQILRKETVYFDDPELMDEVFTKNPPAWLEIVAAGGLAGSYIGFVIAIYSFHYKNALATGAALVGALCLGTACLTLPLVWKYITKSLKGIGISITVLATAGQLWYQNIYLPENIQVGINYSVSIGQVAQLGSHRLVTLDLDMRNESSEPALTLDSMVIVSGISFADSRGSGELSAAQARERMTAYAHSLAAHNLNSAVFQNPDVQYSGQVRNEILAVVRPISDNLILSSGETYSRDFVVAVPSRQTRAFDVRILFVYARAARMALDDPFKAKSEHFPSCAHDERFLWQINTGPLRAFTSGTHYFYSDWCTDLNRPHIDIGVSGAPGAHLSRAMEYNIKSHFGIFNSFRDETVVLP